MIKQGGSKKVAREGRGGKTEDKKHEDPKTRRPQRKKSRKRRRII